MLEKVKWGKTLRGKICISNRSYTPTNVGFHIQGKMEYEMEKQKYIKLHRKLNNYGFSKQQTKRTA